MLQYNVPQLLKLQPPKSLQNLIKLTLVMFMFDTIDFLPAGYSSS